VEKVTDKGKELSTNTLELAIQREERPPAVPSKNSKAQEGKHTEQKWPYCCALPSARQEASASHQAPAASHRHRPRDGRQNGQLSRQPRQPARSDLLEAKAVPRITESQNSRGWKGPLWVI